MKYRRSCLCLFLTLLIGLVAVVTASRQRGDLLKQTTRARHSIINGEVRGNGTLPSSDGGSRVVVELRLSRNERPRPIAKTTIKLSSNATDPFSLPFKLKYPLSKISPHNVYILSAEIRDNQNKLIFLGHLPVPITERQENQAKYLIITVNETPSWYSNIDKLTPLAYKVTQLSGTEEAFTSELYTNKKSGVYTCVVCNSTLFSSKHKYESGTGWPSFYQPAIPDHIETDIDKKYGMTRNEVHCAKCKAHLGHVFDDGPRPTYLRYCMNGVALQFYPDQ